MDDRALLDSLRQMHPRFRAAWLKDRGVADRSGNSGTTAGPEGLRLVGRWSHGPAYDVDCRVRPGDTLIALGRGSGVSLLRFSRQDSTRFELLADVNAERLLNQVMIRDSLLFVGTNAGLEIYDIADARNPTRLSWIQTGLAGFDLKDTLAFVTWYDTFKVYSIANPASPYRVGFCQDSGASVTVAGNTAFLAARWGLYAIDIANPAAPHRIGSWGTFIISAEARGSICCVTQYDPDSLRFFVLNVADPANIALLGSLRGAGGDALHLDGPLVFTAGAHGFQVLDISDTLSPRVMGSCGLSVYKYGVWGKAGFGRALVANEINGLAVMDDGDISHPLLDTTLLGGGPALDLEVRGSRCCVADEGGGMKLLDLSDPTTPNTLGELDAIGGAEACYSVVAVDSFAFMGWFNTPFFRVADISEPTRPTFVGSCNPFEYAKDMVLRDTLVYCAECYKFQVINVARPREPQVVGTCNMVAGQQWGLVLQDTFAYCGSWDGLSIVNVARPATPFVVSQTSGTRLSTDGVAVWDTFAFIPSVYETLWVYSVANPAAPYPIVGAPLGNDNWGYDAVIADTLVFAGCSHSVVVVNVKNPSNPTVIGSYPTPTWTRRVMFAPPYLYACCNEAGVLVLETTAVGITEPQRGLAEAGASLRLYPNPTTGHLRVTPPPVTGPQLSYRLFDATGRLVQRGQTVGIGKAFELDIAELKSGVYAVQVEAAGRPLRLKFVKQ